MKVIWLHGEKISCFSGKFILCSCSVREWFVSLLENGREIFLVFVYKQTFSTWLFNLSRLWLCVLCMVVYLCAFDVAIRTSFTLCFNIHTRDWLNDLFTPQIWFLSYWWFSGQGRLEGLWVTWGKRWFFFISDDRDLSSYHKPVI